MGEFEAGFAALVDKAIAALMVVSGSDDKDKQYAAALELENVAGRILRMVQVEKLYGGINIAGQQTLGAMALSLPQSGSEAGIVGKRKQIAADQPGKTGYPENAERVGRHSRPDTGGG